MKLNRLKLFILISLFSYSPMSFSEGFTANWVDIQHLNNGKYRVIINYTNLEIGEYRQAYVDFIKKKEAIDVFQKLAQGATFYWGDSKTIFFPKEGEKLSPY